MKNKKANLLSLALALMMVISNPMTLFASAASNPTTLGASSPSPQPFGIIDTTPPVLHSITLDKTTVNAPGAITITAKATDDVSGIDFIHIWIENKVTGKRDLIPLEQSRQTDTYQGVIVIDKFYHEGLFSLTDILMDDNAGNRQIYRENPSAANPNDLPLIAPVSFTVINNISPDTTPPTLSNVSIDKPNITVPEKITVTASVSDDLSGVKWASATFTDKQTGRELFFVCTDDYGKGIFSSSEIINKFTLPGIYECTRVQIEDNSGNTQVYLENPSAHAISLGYLPLPVVTPLVVTNNIMSDNTPPVFVGLSFDKTTVETPGKLIATAGATDDKSGVKWVHVYYAEQVTGQKIDFLFSGSLTEIIDISTYQSAGTYECVEVRIYDNAENTRTYKKNPNQWDLSRGVPPLPPTPTLTVINNNDFKLSTNTNNPNLSKDIANLPDGSNVGIVFSGNSHIAADVFEAIKGTNKTITLIDHGIEWVFNGMDITDPKAMDLSVNIAHIEDSFWGDNQEIEEILKKNPAVQLSFVNNGKLPGKATIRVKADYEFVQYLGATNLYAYYYNNTTKVLELVKKDINVSSDGFVEFDITHNSDYVITNYEIKKPVIVNPPIIVTPPTSGGGSSGGSGGGMRSDGLKPATGTASLTESQALALYKKALKSSVNKSVTLKLSNIKQLTFETLDALRRQAISDGVTLNVLADTIKGKKIVGRVYLPNGYRNDILPTVSTSGEKVVKVNAALTKSNKNNIQVIHLEQEGPLGAKLHIATKIDLSKLNTKSLIFYNHNASTNTYSQIVSPDYSIDANGYLHFYTSVGGYIVITDSVLQMK